MRTLRSLGSLLVLLPLATMLACSGADAADTAVDNAQGLGSGHEIATRAQAIAVMTEIDAEIVELNRVEAKMHDDFAQLVAAYGRLAAAGDAVSSAASASAIGGGGQDQLLAATKQMQETQMSFNLQYLQLQSQMQSENRSYTAVSNIMKTKHDTVKNSISNIR